MIAVHSITDEEALSEFQLTSRPGLSAAHLLRGCSPLRRALLTCCAACAQT